MNRVVCEELVQAVGAYGMLRQLSLLQLHESVANERYSMWVLPLYGNTLLQARAERKYGVWTGVPRSAQTARPPTSTWAGLYSIL